MLDKVLDKLQYQTLNSRAIIDRILRTLDYKRSNQRKIKSKLLSKPNIDLDSIRKQFRGNGVVQLNKIELKIDEIIERIINETNDLFDHLDLNQLDSGKKEYLRCVKKNTDFNLQSAIFSLAFNKNLIVAVSNMLNDYPVLNGIYLYYSPPSSNTKVNTFSGSQLFHMDEEDTQLCKIWVILKDISFVDGPTVVLNKQKSKYIAKKIKYKKGQKIEDDSTIMNLCDKGDLIHLVGKIGDVIAVDTAGSFHYGSRVDSISNGRYLLMISYGTSFNMDNGILGRKSKLAKIDYKPINSNMSEYQIRLLLDSSIY
jgi:hypothetical protein